MKVYKLKKLSTGEYFTRTCGWGKVGRVFPRRCDVVASVKVNGHGLGDSNDLLVEEYELTLVNTFHVKRERHNAKLEASHAS